MQHKLSIALAKIPLVWWMLSGFLATYLGCFVGPVFLNANQVMQFPEYVPAADPIGLDLEQMLHYCRSWVAGNTPYIGNNFYPPLTTALFAPLLTVNFSTAFKIVTALNLLSYGFLTLGFPWLMAHHRQLSAVAILFFVTGLFSYGFQFELERGQFNLIAAACAFSAVYLFHRQPRYRWLAYALFSLAVQLKVYPGVFLLLLIDNWRDWSGNIRRLGGLCAANFALFFALGPQIANDFFTAVIHAEATNPQRWVFNHSIANFVTLSLEHLDHLLTHHLPGMSLCSKSAQGLLLTLVAGCLAVIVFRDYRRQRRGFNPWLLLGCTLGALLIPAVSNDYTLSILAGPVILAFADSALSELAGGDWQLHTLVLSGFFSSAYCSTLFSYTNKPWMLRNNFPALLGMLVAVTLISLGDDEQKRSLKQRLTQTESEVLAISDPPQSADSKESS